MQLFNWKVITSTYLEYKKKPEPSAAAETRVFLVAGEPQISNFLEGYEMVVDLYKYMNRSLN